MTRTSPDLLRGADGRLVDPGHLESLGKTAARLSKTAGLNMTDAVVQSIGHEPLNHEQVRRVVEFANIEAFNQKFSSMDADNRIVDICGGPADPVQVLQDLSIGAQPREAAIPSLDYSLPPGSEKTSGYVPIRVDRTVSGIVGDIMGLQSKLASAHEQVVEDAEARRFEMNEALTALAGRAKTAGLHGASVSDVYEAWFRVDPELAKVAHARVKHLISADNVKVAGRALNPEHPVVEGFKHFAKVAHDYGNSLRARQELEAEMARVGAWVAANGG